MSSKSKPKNKNQVDHQKNLALLSTGTIDVQGLVPWSSNYTFLVTVRNGAQDTPAIYKPSRGERPLWDFPTGTLAKRECAAYLVSAVLGWPNIPPTLLRDGPQGPGAVQMFVDVVEDEHFFTLRDAHRDEMKRVALFDAVVNNTDRKAGHILLGTDGRIWCIDHGVTFHEVPKLRTVVWDYVGEKISPDLLQDLRRLKECLAHDEPTIVELKNLLSRREMNALNARIDTLLRTGVYPEPPEDWPHVPWPPI